MDSAGEFVSERLQPAGDDFALAAAVGEPSLPLRFVWRRRTCEVAAVLRRWKGYDADRTHGSGERYLRRHWFEVRLTDGACWTIYFQRQPGPRRSARSRWWLYEFTRPPANPAAPAPGAPPTLPASAPPLLPIMKSPAPRSESLLMKRLRAAAALHRTEAAFAARLVCHRRRITLRGTAHSFTFSEIRRLGVQRKIAQSDVPDNMLALLTALRASTGPIPS